MEETQKKKPWYFRAFVWTVRRFYKKRTWLGVENLPSEPCIVVGNHAQMDAPLSCQLFYPRKKWLWCRGEMLNPKEIAAYSYQDFWSLKPKWIRWFYKLLSYAIVPMAYLFRHADVISVYKDTRVITTLKQTVSRLDEGYDIVIFPESPTPYNEIVNEFQRNFIDCARLYYKKYKKPISFVPCYNAPSLKTVVFGAPIYFNPETPIEEEKTRLCEALKAEITALAKELPRHRVTPYLNVKKKDYPFSK